MDTASSVAELGDSPTDHPEWLARMGLFISGEAFL
jgi:hypothetical protein